MREFLFNYGWIIVALIGIIAYLFYVYKKEGKQAAIEAAEKIAYKIMLAIEDRYGHDISGEEKFAEALNLFYLKLPPTLRYVVPEEKMAEFLQTCFDKMKDLLDDGKINNSVEL